MKIKFIKEKIGIITYSYFLAVGIVMILYAVGYSTGWAMGDSTGGDLGHIVGKVAYNYNQILFRVAIAIFVIWLIGLVSGSLSKQIYKVINYIGVGLMIAAMLTFSIISLIAAAEIRPLITESLQTDASMWEFIFLLNKGSESDIFFILNFSVVILIISLIATLLGALLIVIKVKKQKERKGLREEYLKALEEGYLEQMKFKKTSKVE